MNSLKVPKIKKILLYEMKFLVPNYSCLQNPWLGGYRPQTPFSLSSVLNWICWTPPPNKIPGYATGSRDVVENLSSELSPSLVHFEQIYPKQRTYECVADLQRHFVNLLN